MDIVRKLIYLFNKVQRIGVNRNDSEIDRKHIAISNITYFFYAIQMLLYLPFLIYYIDITKLCIGVLMTAFFIVMYCLYLSYRRRFLLAKFSGVFIGTTLLLSMYLLYGTEINIAFYCIAVLPFPFAMFKKGEEKFRAIAVIYIVVCYLVIQLNLIGIKEFTSVHVDFVSQFSDINIVFSIISALVVSVFNFGKISFFENTLLAAHEEAIEQKKIIETHQKGITESINYSKNIQSAIIPSKEELDKCFVDSFMFYESRDIVSGDFPWLYQKGGYTYVAVIDCTGHGVPGAMLSLVGNLLLNDIVKNGDKNKTPSEILNELHHEIIKTLSQHLEQEEVLDEMDIALCRICSDQRELMFSGACRPLYVLSNGELEKYKGDKFSVGVKGLDREVDFNDYRISLKQGDSIYLFTDGYLDQFGGDDDAKIGAKRFRGLLKTFSSKNMKEASNELSEYLMKWKGDGKQVDDILVMGLKF